MAELHEHHKLDEQGKLLGLYTVDINKGKFTHKDIWGRIDQIIYEYYQLHPIEMEATLKENRDIAGRKLKKYGAGGSKDLELRYHLRMPPGLLKVLEQYEPELFEKREYFHKFRKRYKGLSAVD